MQTKLLINGKLTAGGGKVEDVLNPATGKVLARVAEASREQVNAAVAAADAAFEGWARTPPKDRATLLLKLADRIEASPTRPRSPTRSPRSPTCFASSPAPAAT